MGWTKLENPFEYHFDRPMYYHYIKPDMVVGSQPRHAADVDQLKAEGVTHILNLQQVWLGRGGASAHFAQAGARQGLGMKAARQRMAPGGR